ncbi:hypothetical protein BD324DRAFT_24324 [Kockovaella imperatae]|uniref:Uncharacterized protein n=1 Tax=Kockovaella imperatae TaxID=4999 RepID=A0A1Y1US44_9TREE|nr:hypothetical protein BD324DRAFT_24324 [Kockovaella imperatae]ORX40853.1 hypothetical protein BD324DRAFT_24324 [Kockovaella imperatae]
MDIFLPHIFHLLRLINKDQATPPAQKPELKMIRLTTLCALALALYGQSAQGLTFSRKLSRDSGAAANPLPGGTALKQASRAGIVKRQQQLARSDRLRPRTSGASTSPSYDYCPGFSSGPPKPHAVYMNVGAPTEGAYDDTVVSSLSDCIAYVDTTYGTQFFGAFNSAENPATCYVYEGSPGTSDYTSTGSFTLFAQKSCADNAINAGSSTTCCNAPTTA